MGAREWLPMGLEDVRGGGGGRTPRGAAVDARERLFVVLEKSADVLVGGKGRAPRGAAVVVRERRTVGREDVRVGGGERTPRGAAVGARERLPVGRADERVGGEVRASLINCCLRQLATIGERFSYFANLGTNETSPCHLKLRLLSCGSRSADASARGGE